jgi:hypothetical protein
MYCRVIACDFDARELTDVRRRNDTLRWRRLARGGL